jgi:polysaccharide biosynthesis/export protein
MKTSLIPLCLLGAALGLSQTPVPPSPMEDFGIANLPAKEIGVNDLLAISVYRSPELTRMIRVDPGGAIRVPLLSDPIPAAGKMPADLETSIATALKSGGILVNPVVKVTIAEYGSRPVRVVGAVKRPVTFQAMGKLTLLDAIARAEGLSENAGGDILVTRPKPSSPEGETEEVRISAERLLKTSDPRENIALKGGEEIRVPEAGKVFVVGNVRKPGAYAVPEVNNATVLKILARAEGLADWASHSAWIYRPEPSNGSKSEIAVDLDKILKHKADDVALQPNDIFYVPDSTGRRSFARVMQMVTSFGVSTASGVLIWRQ